MLSNLTMHMNTYLLQFIIQQLAFYSYKILFKFVYSLKNVLHLFFITLYSRAGNWHSLNTCYSNCDKYCL